MIPAFPAPDTPVFTDQTLREIAHASVGGDAVRVRVSIGTDTNYILSGDQTGVDNPAVASTTLALYFLTNIEVRASPDVGLIVCLGDSLTAGAGSTPDAHHTWPDFLAARLVANRHGETFAVVNQGYSGNRLLHDHCGNAALARLTVT